MSSIDEALDYFCRSSPREVDSQNEDSTSEDTAAIETYLILLARLGRFHEALEAWALRVPPEMRLSAYAPTPSVACPADGTVRSIP